MKRKRKWEKKMVLADAFSTRYLRSQTLFLFHMCAKKTLHATHTNTRARTHTQSANTHTHTLTRLRPLAVVCLRHLRLATCTNLLDPPLHSLQFVWGCRYLMKKFIVMKELKDFVRPVSVDFSKASQVNERESVRAVLCVCVCVCVCVHVCVCARARVCVLRPASVDVFKVSQVIESERASVFVCVCARARASACAGYGGWVLHAWMRGVQGEGANGVHLTLKWEP